MNITILVFLQVYIQVYLSHIVGFKRSNLNTGIKSINWSWITILKFFQIYFYFNLQSTINTSLHNNTMEQLTHHLKNSNTEQESVLSKISWTMLNNLYPSHKPAIKHLCHFCINLFQFSINSIMKLISKCLSELHILNNKWWCRTINNPVKRWATTKSMFGNKRLGHSQS